MHHHEPGVCFQALLAPSGPDRSTGLEAHLVSTNSRYIQEQQEQQQVDEGGTNRRRQEGKKGADGGKEKEGTSILWV